MQIFQSRIEMTLASSRELKFRYCKSLISNCLKMAPLGHTEEDVFVIEIRFKVFNKWKDYSECLSLVAHIFRKELQRCVSHVKADGIMPEIRVFEVYK